jgi:hypothetical protein
MFAWDAERNATGREHRDVWTTLNHGPHNATALDD